MCSFAGVGVPTYSRSLGWVHPSLGIREDGSTQGGIWENGFWYQGLVVECVWDGTTSKHSINAPLPVTLTDERHPMAEFWEHFIGTPLTAPLGPLPVGSVFTPKGDVELPSTPNAPVKWIAFGDSLQINSSAFDAQRFQWTELDQSIQSLNGIANE